jgi:thioredoxin reductase
MIISDQRITGGLYDLVILGGGVSGLAAAKTGGRLGLRTLLLEKNVLGGSVAVLETVAGYPGIEKQGGWELTQTMVRQAKDVGCELIDSIEVIAVEQPPGSSFMVKTGNGDLQHARSIIVCTGGEPLMLELADEEYYARRGIHTCAQCAGERYRGTTVVIAGNSGWAVCAADHLLQLGCTVLYVTKDNKLRGEEAIFKEILNHEQFRFLGGCHITGLYGKEKLEEILVTSLTGGNYQKIKVSAVFVYRGIKPNSNMVPARKDRKGFLEVDKNTMTSQPGVFAAGRVVEADLPIAAMAEEGSQAAFAAASWLQVSK